MFSVVILSVAKDRIAELLGIPRFARDERYAAVNF